MDLFDNDVLDSDATMSALAKGLLGFGHPVRVRCVVLLANEHSPSELFELLNPGLDGSKHKGDPSLGTVAYHMRMLRDYGLVEEVRQQPRRGALEHFYVRTELADRLVRALSEVYGLPKPRKARVKREAEALAA